MIKPYLFHLLYHSLIFPKAWNSKDRAWEKGGDGRGRGRRTTHCSPFHSWCQSALYLYAQFLSACLLTLQSSPCASEVPATLQAHKSQAFLPLTPGFSSVPSRGACQALAWIQEGPCSWGDMGPKADRSHWTEASLPPPTSFMLTAVCTHTHYAYTHTHMHIHDSLYLK